MARAKIPDRAIELALRKTMGNVSSAAKVLGVTRAGVYERITANPKLKAVVDEARETLLDFAESSLYKAIRKREAWAVCFALKTVGRVRGYSERFEFEQLAVEVERMRNELQRLTERGPATASHDFPRMRFPTAPMNTQSAKAGWLPRNKKTFCKAPSIPLIPR
jgi:hypothetical protein